MKECWNSEPADRPTLKIIENTISEWLSCLNKYEIVEGIKYIKPAEHINYSELIIIIDEFTEDLVLKQADSFSLQSHPQAYFKSRLLEEVNETLDQDEKVIPSSN